MLTLLRRLGVGFVYGVGFAIGVAGVMALFASISTFWFGSMGVSGSSQSASASGGPRTTPEQFVISDTRVVKSTFDRLNILGTIVNNGGDTPRYVNVYADLFDKNGKFIFQCMTQFSDGLRANQKVNFMIECHGMPKELIPSYDSYKTNARAW